MKGNFDEADLRRSLGPLALDAGELAAMTEHIIRPHRPAIRLNTLSPAVGREQAPFAAEPVPWFSGMAHWCTPNARPAGHPLFAAGAYYIEDAASLLPVELLDPRPGELVCDLCASPGGKATAILERLGGAGWLLVNEAVHARVPPLLLNLARHGSTRWVQTCLDPDELADATGPVFDAVLVDAPCTAQSLVGRGKQTRRAFDAHLIEHSAARQARILDAAVRLLRPGGRLVYSTCTFAWEENEGRIADLLSRFPHLRPAPSSSLTAYESDSPTPACYRLWPHRHICAGGFAARLVAEPTDPEGPTNTPAMSERKHNETTGPRRHVRPARTRRTDRTDRRGKLSPSGRKGAGGKDFETVREDWGRWLPPVTIDARRDRVFAWHQDVPAHLAGIAEAGPEFAFLKGQTWFPAYALAMRHDGVFQPRASVEIEDQKLRRFLAGENVFGAADGWAVATYHSLPLGWVKGDGRTLKNHLPKSVRLLLP